MVIKCPLEITLVTKAKQWIIEMAVAMKTCKCPVCGQTVKLYPRKLSSALARFLIDIYNLTADRKPDGRWINVSKDLIVNSDHHITRDYSILRFWGLLESSAEDAGMWRITESGIAFVEGRMVAPQIAYVYNNHCVRLSETTTDFKGALGSKFGIPEIFEEKAVE